MSEEIVKQTVEAMKLLETFFKDEKKCDLWLKTINPHFGNCSPISLIARGRGHKVLAFIKNALEENVCPIQGEKK